MTVNEEAPQVDGMDRDANLSIPLLHSSQTPSLEAPVNRLPPELLGIIFERLRPPTKLIPGMLFAYLPYHESIFTPYQPLRDVMLVCRKWHIVASERASLWTDVDYSPARRDSANYLLMKSRAAPIHLRLGFSGTAEDKQSLRSMVRANANRLRQLDVWTDSIPTMRETGQILGYDMPFLRGLAMAQYFGRDSTVVCSDMLGNFPSLEGMVLHNFFYLPPPSRRPLTKLIRLYLSRLINVPFESIITLLDSAPALQVLEMFDCRRMLAPMKRRERIVLSHLTHLFVRSMLSGVTNTLVSSLVLPSVATVALELYFNDNLNIIPGLLPQPPLWKSIPRIHVSGGDGRAIVVRLDDAAAGRGLELRLHRASAEWLTQVAWPLPVPGLLQLAHVSAAHFAVDPDKWNLLAPFVACFPALTALVVESETGDLREPAPRDGREMPEALRDLLLQDEPVLCPALKELAVLSRRLQQDLTAILAPALEKRARDGRRVERLRICIRGWFQYDGPENARREFELGDALAEHVGNGEVEHTSGPFWPSFPGESWRPKNEFWGV